LHLSEAVTALHEAKVLASLHRPTTAEDVARKHGFDAVILRGTLDYIAARTDLVRKTSGDQFTATRGYSPQSRFLLEMYGLAYRKNTRALTRLMRLPSRAAHIVDRERHARAFQAAGPATLGSTGLLIRQLRLNHILDLGCGPARMLIGLALEDPQFTGWGVEVNPTTCQAARANIRHARVGGRVRVIRGDARRIASALPAEVLGRVRAVSASQLANEMFATGPSGAVSWLRRLRRVLPGRLCVIADYYGRLGSRIRPVHRETLLHDYAQLISGQGVPPANVKAWQAIYREAGCRLVHVLEDKRTTLFVHLLVL
jgi:SAM-dependent methyltransferase